LGVSSHEKSVMPSYVLETIISRTAMTLGRPKVSNENSQVKGKDLPNGFEGLIIHINNAVELTVRVLAIKC
jgi:hypothetical protein